MCTNQKCVLTRSVYQPGVCTNQECVPTRSVYQPGVCTNQECVPTRSVDLNSRGISLKQINTEDIKHISYSDINFLISTHTHSCGEKLYNSVKLGNARVSFIILHSRDVLLGCQEVADVLGTSPLHQGLAETLAHLERLLLPPQ